MTDVSLPYGACVGVNRSSARCGFWMLVVVTLHIVVLWFALANTINTPARTETPLMVEFLDVTSQAPLATHRPTPRPEPKMAPSRPVMPGATPAPKPARTALPSETTVPAENAPASASAASSTSNPAPAPAGGASTTSVKGSGEDVVGARFDADYLKNPSPPYPTVSRRLREEGKVILRVSVTLTGTAASVEIKDSSGSERLDEAALRTVRQWKFIPARRGDTPVASSVLVPILFKLEQ